MASRTQIVCLCEGTKGASIDEVFINRLMKVPGPGLAATLAGGSNMVRLVPCGGRATVMAKMPAELRNCLDAGGDTTLMVWADCDDDCDDGDALKAHFWKEAERKGITQEQISTASCSSSPRTGLENWIEFLRRGTTDESNEGPRVKHNREVADAAKKLADFCRAGSRWTTCPRRSNGRARTGGRLSNG